LHTGVARPELDPFGELLQRVLARVLDGLCGFVFSVGGLLEDLFDFVMIEMVKQTSPDGAGDAPETVVDYCVDLFLRGTQRKEH
jgi:hypothetical protein